MVAETKKPTGRAKPAAARPAKARKATEAGHEPETAPEGSLGALLARVADPAADEDIGAYTLTLATKSHNSQVQANLHRLKLGLALLKNQPKAKDGVTVWQKGEADRLGIQPRQFRNILGAAKSVKGILATELPIGAEQLLDRPLTKVAAAVKAIKSGRNPDAEVPAGETPRKSEAERAESAIKRLEALIKGVAEAERKPLVDQVEVMLLELKTMPDGEQQEAAA